MLVLFSYFLLFFFREITHFQAILGLIHSFLGVFQLLFQALCSLFLLIPHKALLHSLKEESLVILLMAELPFILDFFPFTGNGMFPPTVFVQQGLPLIFR